VSIWSLTPLLVNVSDGIVGVGIVGAVVVAGIALKMLLKR
jgi:hypothetical protein